MPTLKQIEIGTRAGQLVTISEVVSRKDPATGRSQGYVKVQCDCGSPAIEMPAYDLRKKNPTTACNLCARIIPIKVGSKFGRLVTTSEVRLDVRPGRPNRTLVRVRCDCGSPEFDVAASNLRKIKGATRSCGCLQREAVTTHGLSKKHPRLYQCWKNMLRRCTDPTTDSYPRYGGRGIMVHHGWHDLPAFVAWALDNGYRDGLEIDRQDPDGHYTPANCRWLTRRENIRRAGRLLDSDDVERRLTNHIRQTGKPREAVIGEALRVFLRRVQP